MGRDDKRVRQAWSLWSVGAQKEDLGRRLWTTAPRFVSLVKPAEIERQETEQHVVAGRFSTPPP